MKIMEYLKCAIYEQTNAYLTARMCNLICMRGSRIFCQGGTNFDKVFYLFIYLLVDDGIENQNTTISGP